MPIVGRSILILIAFALLPFSSCEDSSTVQSTNVMLNAPVITNVANSFTYTVNANAFSENSQNILSFSSDSLTLTLSSVEYTSGQAIVSVRDTLNAVIFTDTVRSLHQIVIASLKTTKPRYCSVIVNNLTAKLAFVVVGQ